MSQFADELTALGVHDLQPMAGGWQSLAVSRARIDGRAVVVKVLDASLVERGALETRLHVLLQLRASEEMVCGPVSVGGRLINEFTADVGTAYAVAYEYADGGAPDISRPADASEMGRLLARLHGSLAALPPFDLPALAAFGATDSAAAQVLHGDFSSANIRIAGRGWRVFDFDDCGYGPVEFDLANSLYFVLFDAATGPEPGRYPPFRESFLGGYRDQSGSAAPDDLLDELITRRVLALESWLAHPDTAPLGVRSASAEWRAVLLGFVGRYFERPQPT